MALKNIIGQKTTTTGTIGVAATIDLDGAAIDGHNTFADGGAVSGTSYSVGIKDSGGARQVGRATYTSGTPDTLTVDSVLDSTNGGSAISLSGSAEVYCDALAEDLGGGGLIPISKTTISSSVSAVDIDLTGGFESYLVHLRGVTPTADDKLEFVTSDDGGSTFSTSFGDYGFEGSSALTQDEASSILIDPDNDTNATNGLSGNISVIVGDGTYRWNTFYMQVENLNTSSPASVRRTSVAGVRKSTTAINAIRFRASSSNIDAGEFHLYGIADGDA